MFTTMRLHNFKGWEDTDDVRLAPITLFFGSNSSGKTSLLQSILLLKQTAASSDRTRVLHPGDERSLVDLGTASDLIHGHATESTIEIGLGWTLPEPVEVPGGVPISALGFSTQVRLTEEGHPYVASFNYGFGEAAVGMRQNEKGTYDLIPSSVAFKRRQGRPSPLPAPVRFCGFPDEVANYYQGKSKLEELIVDEYGNITNWPKDFFGDEMGDLAAMTKAGIRRRRAG